MIAEVEGSNDAGLNSAVWDMTTRRERTEAEREEAQERGRRGRGGGGFGGFGRGGAGANRDPRFVYTPAAAATYTVVLKVDGEEYRSAATIVNDHWYK